VLDNETIELDVLDRCVASLQDSNGTPPG